MKNFMALTFEVVPGTSVRIFFLFLIVWFQGARCGEFNGSRYCQALRQMDNHEPHHARRIILNHVKVSAFHLHTRF